MTIKMRLYIYLNLAVIVSILLIIFYMYSIKQISHRESVYSELSISVQETTTESVTFKKNDIVVAAVACGDRLRETLTLIKSALMFSKENLNFIIIAEDGLIESFREKLGEWRAFTNNGFTYKVMPLNFPIKDGNEWKKLFKPCAAQRLFLPDILFDVDSLLYVDTDTLFLTPVESVWAYFGKFNKSQMAALAPEHEDPNVGWYNRFAKHPYYGKLGVNSGVMLMNLTRMRAFQWTEYVVPIYRKFKLHITWGDQDIINIIFHYHPGRLYIYSCRYNYRPDHCMYTSICKPAEKDGVAVIHGSRGFFHSEKQPVFRAIYNIFESFEIGGDVYKDFFQPVEAYLEALENTNCGKIKEVFLKNVRSEFGNVSHEANSILQTGCMSMFIGAIYGGVLESRIAYMNFLRTNEATSFRTHLEAKAELQQAVTMAFGKGAFKIGWRLTLFSTSFVAISTMIQVYRGTYGVTEYVAAGGTTGCLYKFNMGPRGWLVGGGLGAALGAVCGVTTMGILSLAGISMEEARYWQYHWLHAKHEYYRKGVAEYLEGEDFAVIKMHNNIIGEKGKHIGNLDSDIKDDKENVVDKNKIECKK